MHKLASTPITIDCFETGDFDPSLVYFKEGLAENTTGILSEFFIEQLEMLRQKYLETKDKRYWKELVRWLPNGWLQTRTWTGSYANLRNMRHQRKGHKLTEWHFICDTIDTLPYAEEFINCK